MCSRPAALPRGDSNVIYHSYLEESRRVPPNRPRRALESALQGFGQHAVYCSDASREPPQCRGGQERGRCAQYYIHGKPAQSSQRSQAKGGHQAQDAWKGHSGGGSGWHTSLHKTGQ
eukprot:1955895-Pyramimonas_sp.AAC.1